MTRRLTAPQLDDLLATLTPEHIAMIQQFIPIGWADQMRAAQHHSVALMEKAEQTPVRHLPTTGVDEWLRLGLLDTLIRWLNGDAKTCIHMPDPRTPEPVWSCAWRPGLVVCTYCLHLFKLAGDADRVCDCCGRTVTGLENGDGIFTLTVWIGALAYQAGACKDCYQDSALERSTPPSTTCQLCGQILDPLDDDTADLYGVCAPCWEATGPTPQSRDKRRKRA